MTSSKPSNQKNTRAAPPPRRSARQQRLAQRASHRELARAGTRPGGGGDLRTLLLWTLAAVGIGAVVIVGALLLTQQKTDAKVANIMAPGVTTPADVPFQGRTLGKADAPVTIDLWSDFRCTGCFAFAMEIEPGVVKDLVATGKAKLVYHDLVVIDSYQSGNTESRDAANAGLCAADQGKFWPYHDWLFANQSPDEAPGFFTLDRLVAIAKMGGSKLGLDMTKFEPCVRSGTHLTDVANEQTAFGTGTKTSPTIYVNGKLVQNSKNAQAIPTVDDIKNAVTAALNPSPSPSAGSSASGSPAASASPSPTASPS